MNRATHLIRIASIVALGTGVARAGDVGQAADRQQQIEDRTAEVGKQIDSVVGEMQANGIQTENVKTLAAIRGVLGQLSDQQMKDVVTLLRHAGESPAAAPVTDANKEQQRIVEELRDLLTRYQRQAAVDAVAAKLSQLADRQNENLKGTVEAARRANGADASKFSPDVRDAVKTEQAEQAGINRELDQAAKDLESLAKQSDPKDPATDERIQKAAAAMESTKVKPSADNAAQDLNSSKLFQAATDEKATRDKLRDLAAAVAPPVDKATALRKAAEQLDEQIKQEKQVASDAKNYRERLAPTTARKQADVADQSEQTRKALAKASPAAADQVAAAEKTMQAARDSLSQKKIEPGTHQAEAAVDQLEQAKAEVNKELAEATGKDQPEQPQSPAEAVADLKRQEAKLAEQDKHPDQAKPADDPARDQAAVTGKTRDLQSDLVDKNPDAAAALDAAAKHMNDAQDQLAQKHPRKAADEQNAAVAELGKAQDAIDKADKATEQAKADLAQTEAARDQVADAAKKQADAEEKAAAATPDAGQKADAGAKPGAQGTKPDDAKTDAAKAADAKTQAANDAAPKPADAQGAPAKNDAAKPADAQNAPAKNDPAKPADANRQNADAKHDAANDAANKPNPEQAAENAEAAKQAQAAAAQAADQAAKAVDAAPAQAKQAAKAPADQADKAAAGAKQDLDKGDAAAAKPQQQSALDNLEKAKNALDEQVKAEQEKLGIKPDSGQTSEAMKDVAEALAKAQQAAGQAEQAMAEKGQGQGQGQGQGKGDPGQKLDQAAAEAAKAAASDAGQMSDAGKQAMQSAEQHLRQASQQAKAGQTDQAQQSTDQARQEMSIAESESQAIAAAQPGSQPSDTSQTPGQGGQAMADKPGQGNEPAKPGQGTTKNPTYAVTGDGQPGGVRGDVKGGGQFVALPPRDQEAVRQSEKDKYPEQYRDMVEQYYRNLSDQGKK
jgi:hypothetical protein